jgi:acyl carrier protein
MIHNNVLVAYLTPELSNDALGTVKKQIERWLPAYMVPGLLVPLQEFPLNKNGKLDRAKLPTPTSGVSAPPTGSVANRPLSAAQSLVRDVWSELLGVPADQLGLDDNFFARGGTSLLAVVMCRKVSSALGVNLSVAEAFAHQTVSSLSALVDPRGSATEGKTDGVQSRAEHVIRSLWAEMLGTTEAALDRNTNFFTAGGTSLLSVVMSRKVNAELGCTLSVADIFQCQTIAALAELADPTTAAADHAEGPRPASKLLVTAPPELAPADRRLGFGTFGILQFLAVSHLFVVAAAPLLQGAILVLYLAQRLEWYWVALAMPAVLARSLS